MEQYLSKLRAMPLSQLQGVSLREILGDDFWEISSLVDIRALGQAVRELIEEKQTNNSK
jgi:hypothetical protein